MLCKRLAFAEHHRGKHEDVGVIVLPRRSRQTCLPRSLFEKGLAVPSELDGHLRKQHAFMVALLHEKAVLADLYLLNIEHAPEWRQDRDLVLQLSQVPPQ